MNMARVSALRAGLPDIVPGVTINRFCSSGLQSIAMAADRIRSGQAEIIIAGGAESMSLLPMSGHKFSPNPYMVEHMPEIFMGMGLTAENVTRKYDVSRQDADAFAFESHQKALAGLKVSDLGVVELNEAFACQALAVIRRVGLDPATVNPNGGAIALGHPLGCTGAKLTATLLRELDRRQARYGLVTMCVGGGQGAAGIFERLN